MNNFTKEEEDYIKQAFKPDYKEDLQIPTQYDPTGRVSLKKFQENILDGELKELKKRRLATKSQNPKRSRIDIITNANENVEIDNLLELDNNDFNGGKKYKSRMSSKKKTRRKSIKKKTRSKSKKSAKKRR